MHDIKRILVVSRCTKECKKALHQGISLARSYGAELSILQLTGSLELLGGPMYVPLLADLEKEYRSAMQEVEQEFDTIIEAEQAQGMVIRKITKHGHPGDEILNAADEGKIDLLIMAHHPEDSLQHYLLCRDYEKVIRKMPCSIMLVSCQEQNPG